MDPRSSGYKSTNLSTLQLGREISDREIGCAIAHRLAMQKSLELINQTNDQDWVLVLEDDADVNHRNLKQIEKCLANNRFKDPSIVTFYSGPKSNVLKRRSGLEDQDFSPKLRRQRFFLRSVAACYAVNKSALVYLDKFKLSNVDYVADWPPYFAKVKFFQAYHPVVREVDAESTIGLRENQSFLKRIRQYINQLLRIQRIAQSNQISNWQAIRFLIVSPILRDLHAISLKILQ
jgi:hypothetical protein